MSRAAGDKRILAIDPASRGFGFAVLEGPRRLIDWGVKSARVDKDKRCLKLIEDLIERYEPDVIVEDYAGKGSRRCRSYRGRCVFYGLSRFQELLPALSVTTASSRRPVH